jgi:hypothetical protein
MIGITTACSLNLNKARGSDNSTDVSITYVLVATSVFFFAASAGLAFLVVEVEAVRATGAPYVVILQRIYACLSSSRGIDTPERVIRNALFTS